ncbi:ankyrin repeat domain-containing protein [Aspergillus glaucus CBS 516.65]|uniref:Uncharacterized protein n=1 Tax=Aspergillus glaucus CBS 516.65 TaxID=1160497 RepID=A0A1L9V3W3_ASPGL|nr:hypothetical protein ASPGLDRAFT_78102 [Aspergillus glaucus CBS 516.65]OJJ78618.1 hypothetical protein ASPGLDRAFT_78102 [Aspergillus glaucus CBS 516.65]
MALQNLPNELLFLIASNLKTEADINSLSQVNHGVHTTIDPYLYEQNRLKLLLDHTASTSSDFTLSAIRQTYSGWTPLLLAATYGHAEVARLLLDNGMDPNASDSSFRPPLYMACLEGHAAVVNVLLENPNTRVNPLDKSDYIPFYEAVFRGNVGIAAALLAHGAHVSPTEEEGWTPLHSLVRLLVGRQEVNPNALYGQGTALQWAIECDCEDMIFTFSENGETLLLQTLIKGNDKMAKVFLDAEANPNIASRTWLTPAMLLEAPSKEARQGLVQQYHLSED